VFHSGSLLVLPTNIRLVWKSMQVANTLAYYDTAIIIAVKSFIVQAPGLKHVSFFKNQLYENTTPPGTDCQLVFNTICCFRLLL
jgi:hypothetical protein